MSILGAFDQALLANCTSMAGSPTYPAAQKE